MRRSVLSVLVPVLCLLTACGSSDDTTTEGAASPSTSSAEATGATPIAAAEFTQLKLCVKAANGGGEAELELAKVPVDAEQGFTGGPARVLLFGSADDAAAAMDAVAQGALEEVELAQYGNVIVQTSGEDAAASRESVSSCISDVYAEDPQVVATEQHTELLFGELAAWAEQEGYRWGDIDPDAEDGPRATLLTPGLTSLSITRMENEQAASREAAALRKQEIKLQDAGGAVISHPVYPGTRSVGQFLIFAGSVGTGTTEARLRKIESDISEVAAEIESEIAEGSIPAGA